MRFLPLLLFALPFVEIAGFVIVGSHIGVLWTLALVVAAGMLGAVLLRVQGFGAMTRARAELAAGFPEAWQRIQARRHFAIHTLGFPLRDEHLPLSNTFGIVAPFALNPRRVFAIT